MGGSDFAGALVADDVPLAPLTTLRVGPVARRVITCTSTEQIVATLAALPAGDSLSFTRLQDMIGLTPGNLIIHLRKLEDADYISSEKTRNGTVTITTVALTGHGRKALGAYTQALRDLLGGL